MYWDQDDVSNLLLDIPESNEEVARLEKKVRELGVALQEVSASAAPSGQPKTVYRGVAGGVLFKSDHKNVLTDLKGQLSAATADLTAAKAKRDAMVQKQMARRGPKVKAQHS
eukprot:Rhum_TRINITY_DN2824_c0_g1::Rhum_TRINITY_DN2824_c0_g1_i1::g.8527::m.8527